MIAFALVALIGVAILLAPEQEPAPPVSAMNYEARPEGADHTPLTLAPFRGTGSPENNDGDVPVDVPVAEQREEDTHEESAFVIKGTVLDGDTQSPVEHVRLLVSRIPSDSEADAFREKEAGIVAEQDSAAFSEVLDERKRIWADAGAQSDAQGHFSIGITYPGDYQITVIPQAHLKQVVEKSFVGESRPEWDLRIELESGAMIAGRITDSYDHVGIEGLTVSASLNEEIRTREAQTDVDGQYTISGLSPGEYSVIAAIERTAYRVTKELPFKKATITTPDQVISNVDFQLDKGGVVWGYITTPDKDPVAASVILCTSDSVLSQAITAMVRKAPPLSTNSKKEDGYYELLGVPLNQPWRLHVTADSNAPQLADTFVLTNRQKEARVDVFMFTGTNVYGQVVDNKGKGVPDAHVLCIPGFGQILSPLDSPQVVRETNSDNEGYFAVEQLPAGSYQVLAQKEGYKFALRGEPLQSDGYREIKNFRVVLENIEAGKYAVFGTVRSASGDGLSGAKVTLSGLGTESLQGVGRDTTTESGGKFRLEGVEIGKYVLRAEMDGYSPKTLPQVLLDQPNTIIMQTSSQVRGRVLVKDTNTAPENGYTVRATRVDGGDQEDGGFLSLITSESEFQHSEHYNDPQGNYALTLSEGTWQVEGSATGLTPKRVSVTLAAGDVKDDVDIYLTQDGGTVSGHLQMSDGKSPQGANVSLLEASNISQALTDFAQAGGERTSQVAEDGFFSFDQLPEGTYYAIARHPAYPQAMSEIIMLGADSTVDDVVIRMGPGGTLEGFVYEGGGRMDRHRNRQRRALHGHQRQHGCLSHRKYSRRQFQCLCIQPDQCRWWGRGLRPGRPDYY